MLKSMSSVMKSSSQKPQSMHWFSLQVLTYWSCYAPISTVSARVVEEKQEQRGEAHVEFY